MPHVTCCTPGLADDAIADVGSCKLLLSRHFLDDDKEQDVISSRSSTALTENTSPQPFLLLPFESCPTPPASSPLHNALRLCQKLSKDPLPVFPGVETGFIGDNACCDLLELFCVKKQTRNIHGGEGGGGGELGTRGRVKSTVTKTGDISHGHLSDAAFDRMCETGDVQS